MKRKYEHPTITEYVPQVVNLLAESQRDKFDSDIFLD